MAALKNKNALIHGHRNKGAWSGAYNSWRAMKGRCNNVKNCKYQYYGLLGISYTSEWEHFYSFLLDMGNRPLNAELHRKDKKKDYSKDNCEWLNKNEHAKLHANGKERDYEQKFKTRAA